MTLNPTIDAKAVHRWLVARIDGVIVVLGIALRLVEFGRHRSMWMDEGSLYNNIVDTPIFPLWRPLKHSQLAPPGFLAIERLVAQLGGTSTYDLRLLPLVSGIAALLMFRRVSRRLLDARSATVALALFALSYDTIYYSNEIKQYSSDMAVSLACAWTALSVLDGPNRRNLFALLAIALSAPWFSHPAAFTILGMGLGLLAFAAIDRRWEYLQVIGAIGGVAAASFVGAYIATGRMLENPNAMQRFWSQTFLKLPPRSLVDARQLAHQLVDVMVNPLDLISPLVPWLSVAMVALSIVMCCWTVIRNRPRGLILMLLPLLITAMASAAERYPFHGRLILFLVPTFHIALATGLGEVGRRLGSKHQWLANILVALFLLYPIGDSLNRVINNAPREFSPIGDLNISPFVSPPR